MKEIRVIIADDQRLMREGLKAILDLEEDLTVVGTAGDGSEACELCLKDPPDIVLMDIRMPMMDGVEATRRILEDNPGIRVIVLTTFDDDELIIKALKAGASTYLLKDLPSERLIETVRAIHRGDVLMQPEIVKRLVNRAAQVAPTETSGPKLSEDLTVQEREILALMAEGMSNSDIASKLFLSEGTVRNHISSIYGKLGVSDRTQAVLFALNRRLI